MLLFGTECILLSSLYQEKLVCLAVDETLCDQMVRVSFTLSLRIIVVFYVVYIGEVRFAKNSPT